MRPAETSILGEYVATTGEKRRVVAVERGGGWCLLDVPTSSGTTAGFGVVQRLGDPDTFGPIAASWIDRAARSPAGPGWLAAAVVAEARSGAHAIEATVDVYNDRRGMRRLVLAKEREGSRCSHLLDVAVDWTARRRGWSRRMSVG